LTYVAPQASIDSLPDLTQKVLELIPAPDTELIEVDLHPEPYWWPSRLFFLAALLDDWTDIRRLVFVSLSGDTRKDYIGMARPHVIRRSIAARTAEQYEDVYRKAEALADIAMPKNHPDLGLRLRTIAQKWDDAYMTVNSDAESEPDPGKLVTAQELRHLLGDGLSVTSVEWDGGPGTTLDYYLIVKTREEFVALTRRAQPETGPRQLESAVSASSMAIEISRQVLRRQLEGGR
jgi:hypothetical protein